MPECLHGKTFCTTSCTHQRTIICLPSTPPASDPLKITKSEFDHMLQLGIIRASDSSWSPSLYMAPTPTPGDWRPYSDNDALNKVTILDCYPIPHIEDLSFTLHGRFIFAKIYLICAYHQIPVHQDDGPKTVISTPVDLFEFLCMPVDLPNAAGIFQ